MPRDRDDADGSRNFDAEGGEGPRRGPMWEARDPADQENDDDETEDEEDVGRNPNVQLQSPTPDDQLQAEFVDAVESIEVEEQAEPAPRTSPKSERSTRSSARRDL